MSLLVIDDEEEALILLKAYLKEGGFNDVITADSADKGFEILGLEKEGCSKKRGENGVDLVLMDILMPVMDGVDACRVLKENEELQHIPVIMITAKRGDKTLEDSFEAGAIDYITKPINKLELIARVNSAFKLKKEMDMRRSRERELEQALSEIKILSGLLPICSYCNKIRDDQGYWQRLEKYITAHSDAEFTHGICEECMERLNYEDLNP